VIGATTLLLTLLLAAPASAEITEGPCTGSATFKSTGAVLDAARPRGDVMEVPPKDDVSYEGSEHRPQLTDPEPDGGGITVALPLGSWTVARWGGEGIETTASGTYSYEVPDYVPRGTGGIEVTGRHVHGPIKCAGVVTVRLAGSPGAAALVAAAITVISLLGLVGAGFRTAVGIFAGRPILGLLAGFLAGLFGGVSLFLYGTVPLASPLLWLLPLAGIVLGLGLAAWGPFGRAAAEALATAAGTPTGKDASSGPDDGASGA